MTAESERQGQPYRESDADNYRIVNTTGAGDAFTGAYAISNDLQVANATAFLTICKEGAAAAIPSMAQVHEFIESRNQ